MDHLRNWKQQEYTSIATDSPSCGSGTCTKHDFHREEEEEEEEAKLRSRWKPMVSMNASACVLLATFITCALLLTASCTKMYVERAVQPLSFSPLREMVEIRYKEAYIRAGTRVGEDDTDSDSIYRASNTPEVEAAWERLSAAPMFPISQSDIRRLGKDPNVAVKAPASWNWPEGSYLGTTEASHQLHCLNTLRKNLLFNYHYYWGSQFGFTPELGWEFHIMHCLDMLRQHLMCTADTSVVTYYYDERQKLPIGDYGIKKQCSNFDVLDFSDDVRRLWTQPRPGETWVIPPGHSSLPWIPRPTNTTKWAHQDGSRMPVDSVRGLETQQYCLGTVDEPLNIY